MMFNKSPKVDEAGETQLTQHNYKNSLEIFKHTIKTKNIIYTSYIILIF